MHNVKLIIKRIGNVKPIRICGGRSLLTAIWLLLDDAPKFRVAEANFCHLAAKCACYCHWFSPWYINAKLNESHTLKNKKNSQI